MRKKKPSRPENSNFFDNFRLAVCDLNGILRGKRFPAENIKKLLKDGSRMPLSTSCIDIWGVDLVNSPYLFDSGDADGFVMPTRADLIPIRWLDRPTAVLPSAMYDDKKQPSLIDPRHVLDYILDRYRSLGLRPVIAFELEFYLLDLNSKKLLVPKNPLTKRRLLNTSVLSIDELDNFESFLSGVSTACKDHKIPVDTAISENGIGQFEINLKHTEDILVAADHALFFKRLVKGVAHKHSLKASFMAKPFLDSSGSGMHLHMSILDNEGSNIFDLKATEGLTTLHNAVGGLISSIKESTLIFAPHLNSYRRLKEGSHAPTSICWGYENRTASIRIPGGVSDDTRIEHRVAGADANPYLVAAAVLSAALDGIVRRTPAPQPVEGDSYSKNLDKIPSDWLTAIKLFENGPLNKIVYPKSFIEVFSNLKKQELSTFAERMEDFEALTYMDSV